MHSVGSNVAYAERACDCLGVVIWGNEWIRAPVDMFVVTEDAFDCASDPGPELDLSCIMVIVKHA